MSGTSNPGPRPAGSPCIQVIVNHFRNLDCLICDDPQHLGPFASTDGYINDSYCFDADDMGMHQVVKCYDGEYNITSAEEEDEPDTSMVLFKKKPLDLNVVEAMFEASGDRRPSLLCKGTYL